MVTRRQTPFLPQNQLKLSAAIVIVFSALGYDIGCCRLLESSAGINFSWLAVGSSLEESPKIICSEKGLDER